ncbi:MAG: S9 family peptidase [Candidatus Heimdallarchaeota archaeon]|nr:S9 family peptidase [Candidatus Heimdallarchaeota archaeon]
MVNTRGGGEYGKEWHNSGMLDKKQNVFNDFIAASKWITREFGVDPKKIAILGGSNGGLLVAASMLQAPECFGAVVCSSGVLDMIRFPKFSIGKFWKGEYGDPEKKEHIEFLLKYSPVHNVKREEYPACLVDTGENDIRVDPMHSKKFIAELQEKGTGGPYLLKIYRDTGHGLGTPTQIVIEELSYQFSFILKVFGLEANF